MSSSFVDLCLQNIQISVMLHEVNCTSFRQSLVRRGFQGLLQKYFEKHVFFAVWPFASDIQTLYPDANSHNSPAGTEKKNTWRVWFTDCYLQNVNESGGVNSAWIYTTAANASTREVLGSTQTQVKRPTSSQLLQHRMSKFPPERVKCIDEVYQFAFALTRLRNPWTWRNKCGI